jgi:hypothetical protein
LPRQRVTRRDAEPRAFALFAHCFTCCKDSFAASRIAEGLAARNIAVLRFDFTGSGSSEGEFANTNFSSNVQSASFALCSSGTKLSNVSTFETVGSRRSFAANRRDFPTFRAGPALQCQPGDGLAACLIPPEIARDTKSPIESG